MMDQMRVGALLQQTARGAGWIIAWRAVTRGLGFISILFLARLLVPADFGLVALAASFAQAIDTLVDLGVQDAVVRAHTPSREFYDTAFTVNAIRGVTTAILLIVTAWPVASFFGEPRLSNILFAFAASVLIGAFENIGIADFRRNFAFQSEFQLWVFPRVAQVIVTITLALLWPSYWALVAGILTTRVLRNISGYMMHPYRPRFTLTAWRQIFSYSLWTWLIGMVNLIRSRVTVLTIGRMLNPTLVGVYSLGAELAALPETELVEPLCRVSFSSFAATQRSGTGVAETYLRIIASTLAITLPAGVGMMITANALVALAFGPKWLDATPVVEVLAISGLFNVVGRISGTLFSAYAYLRSMFGIAAVMLCIQLSLVFVLVWQWGILGAAVASAVAVVIEQTIYCWLTFRRLHLHISDLLRRIWRCLLATAVMAAVLAVTSPGRQPGPVSVIGLLVTCASGAAVYIVVLATAWFWSGRPAGAEADLREIASQAIGYLVGVGRRAFRLRPGGTKSR